MEKVNMTCIVCPVGCRLEAELEGNAVRSVSGNSCPRGKKYAVSELTNPVRTLTSTVRIEGGSEAFLPVRTSAPIPKGKLFDAMRALRGIHVSAPVRIGDTLAEDFIADGVRLIACKDIARADK